MSLVKSRNHYACNEYGQSNQIRVRMSSGLICLVSSLLLGSNSAHAVWSQDDSLSKNYSLIKNVSIDDRVFYNIPAQSLSQALVLFGKQAGLQIASDPSAVAGYKTQKIIGKLSQKEVLKRLLRDTDLKYRHIDKNAVIVSHPNPVYAQAGDVALDTILVDSGSSSDAKESAVSPVKGYNAKRSATGTKTDTPLRETPQSVSVVGTEQMRDQGVMTLQEAMRYVPGVVSDSHGLDSRTDGLLIRGTAPAQFLDGMRQNFNTFFYGYRVDPFFMERIEALRGPSSVLFGQAPVGGIINSVSKRPQEEAGGEFTFEYGTFDFKQVKFDTTGELTKDGKWLYRLTGLMRSADTQVDYVEDDRYAFQPSVTWRPDSDTSITLLGHFQRDKTGSTQQFFPHIGTIFPNVNGRKIPQNTFAGEPGDYYNTDVASGTLLFEHDFNSSLKLKHSSRYSDINNEFDTTSPTNRDISQLLLGDGYLDGNNFFHVGFPGFGPVIPVIQERVARVRSLSDTHTKVFNQDTNLEAKFSTGSLNHRVLGGIDYSNFKARNSTLFELAIVNDGFNVYAPQHGVDFYVGRDCNSSFYTSPNPNPEVCRQPDQKITQTGLYIQDQMRLGNWIGVIGGRKDWAENAIDGQETQKDDEFTYRAGLMYEFDFGLTPYVNYSESFVPVAGRFSPVNGGEAFDPQEGRMYEIGFKYQPKGSNFSINGSYFDIEDTGRLMPDAANPAIYQVQIGTVTVKGFEIEVVGQVTDNLKLMGGYSYTDAKYSNGTTIIGGEVDGLGFLTQAPIDVSGNQIESIPQHLASLWGLWEFDQPLLKGWAVGGGVRYIGNSWDGSNTVEVPSVTLYDAMISFENDDWRWQLTGRNLADKQYVSTCLTRGDCFLGAARTITTGLTYKF